MGLNVRLVCKFETLCDMIGCVGGAMNMIRQFVIAGMEVFRDIPEIRGGELKAEIPPRQFWLLLTPVCNHKL